MFLNFLLLYIMGKGFIANLRTSLHVPFREQQLNTSLKPWPVVDDFLKTRKTGDLGADVGCGNGKYLSVNPAVFCVGSDRHVWSMLLILLMHEVNGRRLWN